MTEAAAGSGYLETIKKVVLDIDPNDVLKDAKEYGLKVNCIADFRNQADRYVFTEKLAGKYADVAASYCAAAGATSGVGGFTTAIPLMAADLANMAAQIYRLNQKVAVLHGFDPNNEIHQNKVLGIYLVALGIDAASSALIRQAVTRAAQENVTKSGVATSASIRVVMLAAKSLGIQVPKATAAKMIPFLGAAIGGGFNYLFAQAAARKILLEYKSDYFDKHQAEK